MRVFDVIKNESHVLDGRDGTKSVLAWKFSGEDFYDRSPLIVDESEEAVFYRDGLALQVFPGGRYTLDTANHPFLSALRAKLANGATAFSCKVYFVSKDHKLELLWGTDTPIQLRDPVLRVQTSIKARGSYSIQVIDSKKFLVKLVGNNIQYFTQDELNRYFRSVFLQEIKDGIAHALEQEGREILSVINRRGEVARTLLDTLGATLEEYGVRLVGFSISAMDLADSAQRERLEEAFGSKGIMGILGEDWARQQSAEILRDLAQNPGAGGIAAAGAGMGVGFAAGNVFNDMAQQMFAPGSRPPAQPAPDAGAGTSRFMPAAAQVDTRPCLGCGHANPAAARFCGDCGNALELTCGQCRATLTSPSRFCSECGSPLGGNPR